MEKLRQPNGGGAALTVFLILIVLALAAGLAYVIFGVDVLPGLGNQADGEEVRQEETGSSSETGGSSETERKGTSGSPNFVPIVLPDGTGEDDVTPFAQADPGTADGSGILEPGGAAQGTGGADGTESGGTSGGETGGAETGGGTSGETGGADAQPSPESAPPAVDFATANKRPKGLTMSTEDFTVTKIGQKTQLTASGGAGVYNWISQNPGIASVDASGLVTAVTSGTTTVLATDGVVKGTCVVRVKALSEEYSLNKTDFTRSVAEGPYQLKLSGYSGPILWTSSDTHVATVSSDGTVTPVSAGFAVITASWENHSRQCFVHVTG